MKHKETIPLRQEVPGGEDAKILLHACCAPCSGAIIEFMLREGLRPTVFYSNANIFPLQEYEIRRDECRRWCETNGLPFLEDDYDSLPGRSLPGGSNRPRSAARVACNVSATAWSGRPATPRRTAMTS